MQNTKLYRIKSTAVKIFPKFAHFYKWTFTITFPCQQAGLDPCWSQTHYVGFVMMRLISFFPQFQNVNINFNNVNGKESCFTSDISVHQDAVNNTAHNTPPHNG
jgi:hypothetical protein